MIFCPACKNGHLFSHPNFPNGLGAKWEFSGSLENPTFAPSIIVRTPAPDFYQSGKYESTCHSFVRNGKIEFLGDCTHPLAGKTVDLPDWDSMPDC